MQLDRKKLFDHVRPALFRNRLSSAQVHGIEVLLDEWDTGAYGDDPRHLANVLAQVFHETGGRMLPVREGFAANDAAARKRTRQRRYGTPDSRTRQVYYGRGQIQLTWAENYRKLGGELGLDLLTQPDLALDPRTGARIAFIGMAKGLFARDGAGPHRLARYFNAEVDDAVGARRIVNGTDRAEQVAGYHRLFAAAVRAATGEVKTSTSIGEADPSVIRSVQQLLRDRGWPEVGEVDGRLGPRTRDTLAAAARHYGWAGHDLSDRLISDLVRAPMRESGPTRVSATEKDLSSSTSVRLGTRLRRFGTALLGSSLIGGIMEGTASLDDITSGIDRLQALGRAVLSLSPWVLGLAAGVVVILVARAWIHEQVEAYRQGRHV